MGEVRLCVGQVQGRGLLETEVIQREPGLILELIEAGRGDDAVAVLQRHLSRARKRLVGALDGDAGPEVRDG